MENNDLAKKLEKLAYPKETSTMDKFGQFCFGLILLLLITIINGYTLMVLWGWFVAPVFKIQELTILQAIGLCLIILHLRAKGSTAEKKDKKASIKGLTKSFGSSVIYAGVALLSGWVVTLFM